MALSLSIILPVLNESGLIQSQLQKLQPLREQGAEIIVVDGGSTDDSARLASGLADRVITSEAGRARQMNAGAEQASREWLLFLHIDTTLPASMSNIVMAWDFSHATWGFFNVRLDGEPLVYKVLSWFINRRSYYSGIGTGDQCLFVRRDVFSDIGGYSDIPLMEDIELCKRLKKKARPLIVVSKATTSARKWQREGVWRTVFLMWRLRLAYFFGADPHQLAQKYYDRKYDQAGDKGL